MPQEANANGSFRPIAAIRLSLHNANMSLLGPRTRLRGPAIVLMAYALCAVPASAASPAASYSNVRRSLMRSGWRPVVRDSKSRSGAAELVGDTRIMFDAGFREVESCSGIGPNYCTFIFKKGRTCRFVVTVGELDHARTSPIVQRITTDRC